MIGESPVRDHVIPRIYFLGFSEIGRGIFPCTQNRCPLPSEDDLFPKPNLLRDSNVLDVNDVARTGLRPPNGVQLGSRHKFGRFGFRSDVTSCPFPRR